MGLGCKLRDLFRVVKSAVSNIRYNTISIITMEEKITFKLWNMSFNVGHIYLI